MKEAKPESSQYQDLLQSNSIEIEITPQPTESSTEVTLTLDKARERKRDPYRLVGITLANKYRLEEYAGGGGMGAVYRCYHTDLAQAFALKILKPDIVINNPIYSALFEREVEAARQLDHPHIVKLLDSGVDDNISFMVMEWLDGHTLEDTLQVEHLEINRVVDIFSQICSAFATAHAQKIIHLDIKPANVFMVDNGQLKDFVKVIDFGLARVLRNDSGTTVTRFLGTYQYCSPEHFGGKLTHRSDIYSLGVMLYQLLTGILPFQSSHIQAKMHPNLEMPPIPSLLKIRPDLSEAVERLILKALNRNPDDRQQSVQQLFEEVSKSIDSPLTNTPSNTLINDKANTVSILLSPSAMQPTSISPQFAKTQLTAAPDKLLKDFSKRYWKIASTFALIITIATIAIIVTNLNRPAPISQTPDTGSTEFKPNQRDILPDNGSTQNIPSEDISTKNWNLKQTLRGHESIVWSVAFSPDGRTLASSSQDITVKLWDAETGILKRTLSAYSKGEDEGGVSENVVTFSPDGKLLAIGNYDRIVIWYVQSGGLKALLTGHEEAVKSVAFSPNGLLLASASGDNTVKLWEVQSEKLIMTILVCPGECLAHGATTVAFSPNGKLLATGDSEGDVKLWDIGTGLLIRQLKGHSEEVWTVAFSPDGKSLASASGDGTVRLWDVYTGESKHILNGHAWRVWSVAFSPGGTLLASGSFDGTVKLWYPLSGKLKQTLSGHEDAIHGIAFSPDGRTLASASNDKTIKLWSITEKNNE